MPRPRIPKTKTFAGCWTCRRRKVKCDNRRPHCYRCGDRCEGYDLDLYWIDEENERACTVKRRAMLVYDPLLPVSGDLQEIDDLLTLLDDRIAEGELGCVGPFSAFMTLTESPHDVDKEEAGKQEEDRHDDEAIILAPSSFVDPLAAELMDHYIHVVAHLLQPARHPLNPYHSIYVPRAISSGQIFVGGAHSSPSSSALSHALLSVSAFHRSRQSPHLSQYERMGRLYRIQAVSCLQKALKDGDSLDDLSTTLSAMLSMVSIDLMEGGMTEFWIHLDGCQRLRSSQALLTYDSSASNSQLLATCAFMETLSRSTNPNLSGHSSFPQHPIDILDDDNANDYLLQDSPFLPADQSLEFTYGTTATLANYLYLTLQLTQRVESTAPTPHLTHALTTLQTAILTWSIDEETLSSVPAGDSDTRALLTCHILAFHAALVIYFHCLLIRPIPTPILRSYNRICVSNLLAAESLKSTTSHRNGWTAMAPIVWPGFIAACEAELDERPLWRAWWIGVQRYRIGSISTLWDVVQQVWEDGNEERPRWQETLRRRGRRVMSGG